MKADQRRTAGRAAKRQPKSNKPATLEATRRMQELDRLGATPAEVMKALREAGIKDLEELVRRVIATSTPEPEPLDPFAPSPPPASGKRIVHRAPQVAFTVDDVLYDPEDIKRFNGNTLHFIVRPTPNRDHALVGFVGDQWLQVLNSYFQAASMAYHIAPSAYYIPSYRAPAYYGPHHYGPHPYYGRHPVAVAAGINPGHEIGWCHARFCEDINFQGDRLGLDKNRVWPDLSNLSMGFLAGDWNDKISSVLSDGATLLIFEHANFVGDTLLIPATNEGNFVELGWNDRASSLKNFGVIY